MKYKTPEYNEYYRKYRAAHKEIINKRNANRKQKLRHDVLYHYSDGKMCCAKCGYSDLRALTIDHINGGGNIHRKENSNTIGEVLKMEGYPFGYQVLCMNCQFIKRHENKEVKTNYDVQKKM